MTKEEWKEKIDAILSDKDRKVANILFENTLQQMQIYYQNKIEELKQQLMAEKITELNRYEIAITVCEREKINLLEDVLFPMNVSDIDCTEYFFTEEDSLCFPIWIEADDKEIEQYLEASVIGSIYTNMGEIETKFELIKNTAYLDIVEECKKSFVHNGLCSKCVNDAYLHKFFYLEANLHEIQEDMEIVGYSLKSSEFIKKIRKSIVPLWNVRYVTIQANDFPVIQEDRINYRYDFAVTDNTELVIDTPDCSSGYCTRYPDKLSFFADNNNMKQFSFWQIWSNEFELIRSDYLILTNGVNKKMWSSQECSEIVHSAWELARKIKTLSVGDKVEYQGYQILEEYENALDYVVAEEMSNVLKGSGNRNYLELIIHNISLPQFIYRNTVQYIVNTIQNEFREYIVICRVSEI